MMKSQKVIVGVGLVLSVFLLVGIVFQIRSAKQERLASSTPIETMDIENKDNKENENLLDKEGTSKESLLNDDSTSKTTNIDTDKEDGEEKKKFTPQPIQPPSSSKTTSTSNNAGSGTKTAVDKESGLPQGTQPKVVDPKPTEPPASSTTANTETDKKDTTKTENTAPKPDIPKSDTSKPSTPPPSTSKPTTPKPTTPKEEKPEIVKGGTGSDGILRDLNGNPVPWGQGETTPHIIDSKDLGTPGKGMGEGDKF